MSESSEDEVYLRVGPEYDESLPMRRSELPNDAIRAAINIDGREVWTVER